MHRFANISVRNCEERRRNCLSGRFPWDYLGDSSRLPSQVDTLCVCWFWGGVSFHLLVRTDFLKDIAWWLKENRKSSKNT